MTLLEKLQVKGNKSVLVLSSPPELSPLLQEISAAMKTARKAGAGPFELILVYVQDSVALAAALEQARALLIHADLLWFAYPKKTSKRYSSDLSRDFGWETLENLGFRPVRQIALDDDWSALRFRHQSAG